VVDLTQKIRWQKIIKSIKYNKTFHMFCLKNTDIKIAAKIVRPTSNIEVLKMRNGCDPGGPNIFLYLHNGFFILLYYS